MRLLLYLLTIVLITIASPAMTQAQGVITIRLSYKVVLNPADGTRPIRTGTTAVADADIDTAVNAMNTLLQTYFRGYRVQRVDPITNVGGMNDTTGPSRWFSTNFFDANNGGTWKDQMEAAAVSDARYRWNNNAINIYIVNGFCGGLCSFPNENDNIILMGGCSANSGGVQLHEIGHYFSFCHTQGCACGCGPCGTCSVGTSCTTPGDDGIADTLPDLACWDQNAIARNSFGGRTYAQLNAGEQSLVDDVFFNLMSYHGTCCSVGGSQTRLTEQQLDRWSDTASRTRTTVRDGFTFFVDRNAPASQDGSSGQPFSTVQRAVSTMTGATGSNILILRPGAYNERISISIPMTLRATRRGSIVIGSATIPPTPASFSQEEIDQKLRETLGIYDTEPAQLGFPGTGRQQE